MHRPAIQPAENVRIEKRKYFSSFASWRMDNKPVLFKDSFGVEIDKGSGFVSFFKIGRDGIKPVEADLFKAECIKKVCGRAVGAWLMNKTKCHGAR